MGLQAPQNSFATWKMGLYTSDGAIGLNLNKGLQWYYELEEISGVRFDSSLDLLDLTQAGTVAQGTGILGDAASFNGSAVNKLSHVFDSHYDLSSTDFTLTGWVFLADKTTDRAILYMGNGSSANADRMIEIKYVQAADEIAVFLSNGIGQDGIALDIGGSIPTNEWIFWSVRFNNTTQLLEFSLNGLPFTSITSAVIPQNTGDQSFVLGNKVTDSDAMAGRIDEVGGWDRRLTDQEITFLFGPGRPTFSSTLEDDEGNVLEDDEGNALVAL
jgi:hypothetical protein